MLDYEFCTIDLVLFSNLLTIALIFVLRNWFQGGQFQKKDIRIDGKVVVITGANTGIGKETALELANRGIINVSSIIHQFGQIYRDDMNLNNSYSKYSAYNNSKLANVLFTRELSQRLTGTGVVVNSLHPGIVDTDIKRNLIDLPRFLYSFFLFFKTPKSGAQTTIALALDPDLKTVTGKYFSDCKITRESAAARSDDNAKWLWETSENVTALKK